MAASLVRFRNDLRQTDNPALIAAPGFGRGAVPVYVLDEETVGLPPSGADSRGWLHRSLQQALGAYRTLKQSA